MRDPFNFINYEYKFCLRYNRILTNLFFIVTIITQKFVITLNRKHEIVEIIIKYEK